MYKVKVTSHFSSAHNLRGYKGKCEDLHGHNWRVEVSAFSKELDELGMVVDFKELKAALGEVLGELDHSFLNDVEYFKRTNPTSENIARFIYQRMEELNPSLRIREVTVHETDTSSATYVKDR
ncbi:MAG: 6-carboxytetrahydropterin synthase QueD [Candidatus Omnitrophica bacterium]|nr:6-carboxytetrahydropterin synthase QueD [Candidatus Omnitrophota bacterium]